MMNTFISGGVLVAAATATFLASPSSATAAPTASFSCKSSLTGTAATYYDCTPTPSGYSQFRATAPCFQSNTQTHFTAYGAWVAFSNHTTKSTANCGTAAGTVRQGDPQVQIR